MSEANSLKPPSRKVYLDFIKIIAIYLVLFNHTQQNGWALFTVSVGTPYYPFYLFIAIFAKINVPLFFMCSGALLLHKNESYSVLFKKRFLRIIIVLFVGSLICYVYQNLRWTHTPLSASYFFKTLYTSTIQGHMWFLYAYLAFILMLPLLRRLAQGMRGRDFIWITVAYAIYRSLYIIDFLIFKGNAVHNSDFNLFINMSYVYYPIMGYFIDKRLDNSKMKIKYFIIMVIFSIVAISVSCLVTHYRCSLLGEWKESQPFVETFVFVPTITFFYGIKLWFMRFTPGKRVGSSITLLGSSTFGLYIIEGICRNETKPVFVYLQPIIKTLPACLIWMAVACMVGFIITILIKKIPIIKKYI